MILCRRLDVLSYMLEHDRNATRQILTTKIPEDRSKPVLF
jgi:hypothetical protein